MSKQNPPRPASSQPRPTAPRTTFPPQKPPPPPPTKPSTATQSTPPPPPKAVTLSPPPRPKSVSAPPPAPPKPVPKPVPPPSKQPSGESPGVLSEPGSGVVSRLNLSYRDQPMSHGRKTILCVYSIHAFLSLFAVLQLIVFRILEMDFAESISPTIPTFVWLLIAMGCIVVLAFVNLANHCPCNCLLAIIGAEVVMIFVNSNKWCELSYLWICVVLMIVASINIILYIIGIYVPLKLLPGNLFIIVLTLCCVVIVISIYSVVYLNGNRYMLRYVSMISLFYAMVLVVFTVTVVHQRRSEYLDRSDYVLQGAILAMIFVYMIHALTMIVIFARFLVEHV
ncbi:two pore potassium channel c [Drosophila eugracilis]|uniref:two pore potassium channel c n=1 Tax=Drosophila eugracilis TaxID=29029 RepID=UPI001BD979AB|nr:two pore potassium channel c [Drosophila eugracilis]